jgi:hypothetical protein
MKNSLNTISLAPIQVIIPLRTALTVTYGTKFARPVFHLNLVAADKSKMVRLKDVQGRIYHFKSKSECTGLGIPTPVVPEIVRRHMIFVLDVVVLDYSLSA